MILIYILNILIGGADEESYASSQDLKSQLQFYKVWLKLPNDHKREWPQDGTYFNQPQQIQQCSNKHNPQEASLKSGMIFEGSFDALKALTGVTTYYPDTGLLVYDLEANKLILHLTKEDVQCQGIVLGYVMDQDAIAILDSLRASTIPLQARLENTYNYYLKRTLNVSLAVSLLVFYNAFNGSQKSKFGVFERDEKSPQVDSK